jgi:hypothetical protein
MFLFTTPLSFIVIYDTTTMPSHIPCWFTSAFVRNTRRWMGPY